jgi:hypothetical protein
MRSVTTKCEQIREDDRDGPLTAEAKVVERTANRCRPSARSLPGHPHGTPRQRLLDESLKDVMKAMARVSASMGQVLQVRPMAANRRPVHGDWSQPISAIDRGNVVGAKWSAPPGIIHGTTVTSNQPA